MHGKRSHGFSLIELMVVLVIIGICSATLGIGMGRLFDPARQLQQDAEQLAQRLATAQHEARIDGRSIRWQADAQGYRFLRQQQGRWVVSQDEALRPQRWQLQPLQVQPHSALLLSPEWFGGRWQLRLSAQGRQVQLGDDGSGRIEVQR